MLLNRMTNSGFYVRCDAMTSPSFPMIIRYLDWKVFGRENLSSVCLPFLASELADGSSLSWKRSQRLLTHWFSQMMFTGLFQSDAQTLPPPPLYLLSLTSSKSSSKWQSQKKTHQFVSGKPFHHGSPPFLGRVWNWIEYAIFRQDI